MDYRRFGKTNEMISVITLGGMRFPGGWDAPRDRLPRAALASCIDSTRRAFASGINHLESAYGYVKSEHLFGAALKELGRPRSEYKVMTKGAPMTAEDTRRLVESQLKALGLDYVDFYGWHGLNNEERLRAALHPGGPVEELHRLREEGLIRHIGFSTHAPLAIILKGIDSGLFSFVNLHYYYFFQRNLPAVKRAGEVDMGVFIISPNEKGGMLWNPSEKVRRLSSPLSPIQFNARFCLSHPEVTTLSMGMHVPEHFEQNLALLDGEGYFSRRDLAVKERMDAVWPGIDSRCTLCDECLPCPEDINIPEVLRFRNLLNGFDMETYGRFRYNMLEGKGHWFPGTFASNCTECGDCLPRCPEHLDIPRLLKETHRRLFSRSTYVKNRLAGWKERLGAFFKTLFASKPGRKPQ